MEKAVEYELLKAISPQSIHISFSEFSKYKNCGHKHLLEKYLKLVDDPISIHLIFGNSIHRAIEIGIKTRVDVETRVSTFREDFYKEMFDKMYDTPEFKLLNNFLNQGENIIRYVSTEKLMKKYEVIGVEYPLYEPLYGVFHFKGFIDLIVRDRKTGRYVVIDWKTSGEAWDVSKKKKDEVFMAQMRLYKYFFSRKSKIPFEQIDCKYIVLNRLKSKNYPEMGMGELQTVEIYSDYSDIERSIAMVAETIRKIHIENVFPKAKLIGQKGNCYFCPHKNNFNLCNNSPTQGAEILKESRLKS